jgi:hypothetical protein
MTPPHHAPSYFRNRTGTSRRPTQDEERAMSMPITTAGLTRAAGACAVAAGLLFSVVEAVRPHDDVASVTTTAWTVTHLVGLAMAGLALVGICGIYLRQVSRIGPLGLIGFVLFGSCFLLITAFEFAAAFVLPSLADQAPGSSTTSSRSLPVG